MRGRVCVVTGATSGIGKETAHRLAKEGAHLKKQPYTDPFLDAPHFVATFVAPNGRKSQKSASTFHSIPLAAKWINDMRAKLPEADRNSSQVAIRGFANRAQAEVFARQWLAQ